MKRILLFIVAIILHINSYSQIPQGYYDSTIGKSGYELKTELYKIISKNHKPLSYNALWTAFERTDMLKDSIIWDMYSYPPIKGYINPYTYKYPTDEERKKIKPRNEEGQCYNREHSFPKSWFGGEQKPMYTDLFHIYPTDKKVNSVRENYPYGNYDIKKPLLYTSQNGSKLGYCRNADSLGDIIVFEPIDEYKGDFARTYFYMATRYQDKIAGWKNNSIYSSQVLAGNNSTVYQTWYIKLLLEWHKLDPVSSKEINRNNAVYLKQLNRNPFIDSTNFVERIWKSKNK
ncbi:MAG: endonuclease [Bacteroidetes bacterium]|nr:endonuclease [Bacteroidota bacterium]